MQGHQCNATEAQYSLPSISHKATATSTDLSWPSALTNVFKFSTWKKSPRAVSEHTGITKGFFNMQLVEEHLFFERWEKKPPNCMKRCLPQEHLPAGRWSNITFIHIPSLEDILLVQEWRNPRGKVVYVPARQRANSLIHVFPPIFLPKQDFSVSSLGHKSKKPNTNKMRMLFILWHRNRSKFCWLHGTQRLAQSTILCAFLCSHSCPHHHVFMTTNSKVSLKAKSQFLHKLGEEQN